MKNLNVKSMNENLAKQILDWKYEKPYDFYNNKINEESIKEMLDGSYRILLDEKGDVFGFFCTGAAARIPIGHQFGVYNENFIDMGLGISPNYVGKGYGYNFCTFIMNYIRDHNTETALRLSVATFNKRAIYLYEKLGFVMKDRFTTNSTDFITMINHE